MKSKELDTPSNLQVAKFANNEHKNYIKKEVEKIKKIDDLKNAMVGIVFILLCITLVGLVEGTL